MSADNLTQMVKEGSEKFPTSELELPDESQTEEPDPGPVEEAAQPEEQQHDENAIPVKPLVDWFDENISSFENINAVRLQLRHVDSRKTLVVTVPTEDSTEEEPKRTLEFIKNADVQPVLAIPGLSMDIYNNGYRIIYGISENEFIKTYGVKTGMVATFCVSEEDLLIPFAMERLKKKETALQIKTPDGINFAAWLNQAVDKEALQILYKQSRKVIDDINTNRDAVKWLLSRQEDVRDLNHHMQIDQVIITLLNG